MIEPFTVLAEDEDLPRWDVPEQLAALYGGAIGLDEPSVVANFVESLDGVVAVPRLPRSHAVIGDESEADRFVLALMRACADAVVVGSGTLLASPRQVLVFREDRERLDHRVAGRRNESARQRPRCTGRARPSSP